MTIPLRRIASRVFGRPLLLEVSAAETIAALLRDGHRLSEEVFWNGPGIVEPDSIAASIQASRFYGSSRRETRPAGLTRMTNGAAVITIDGELVNRGAWIGANSGLVSYEGIDAQLRDAAADPEVKAIVLDLNTPGGEVDGIAALGALIAQINQSKPVTAVVNDLAASAGYWIASQAREIVISPTSRVGSIGVVYLHLDRSEQIAKLGIKPTLIYAGDHKVDFNMLGPLSEDAQKALQAEIDGVYSMFTDAVASGRGNRMSKDRAKSTEARVYTGQDAIAAGLADRMATFADVLNEIASAATPSSSPIAQTKVLGKGTASEKISSGAEMSERTVEDVQRDAAEIVKLCNAAGVASIAPLLMTLSIDAAKPKIEEAKEIVALCAKAAKTWSQIDSNLAASYLATGASLEHVRGQLFDKVSALQEAQGTQRSQHATSSGAGGESKIAAADIDPSAVYARRAKDRQNWRLETT
jgi:signal peptide peptidase SppA